MSDPDDILPPLYPIPLGVRVKGDWFPFYHKRFRDSEFAATVDFAAGFLAIRLWAASAEQDPPGTLPDDDRQLAQLAGLGRDVESWRKYREAGALDGFEPVTCADDVCEIVRLGHPVVAEVMCEVVRRMDEWKRRSQEGASRRKRSRLREVMTKHCGAHAGLTQRDEFVDAVQDWLDARGLEKRPAHVREAMQAVSLTMDGAGARIAGIARAKRLSSPD